MEGDDDAGGGQVLSPQTLLAPARSDGDGTVRRGTVRSDGDGTVRWGSLVRRGTVRSDWGRSGQTRDSLVRLRTDP